MVGYTSELTAVPSTALGEDTIKVINRALDLNTKPFRSWTRW